MQTGPGCINVWMFVVVRTLQQIEVWGSATGCVLNEIEIAQFVSVVHIDVTESMSPLAYIRQALLYVQIREQ